MEVDATQRDNTLFLLNEKIANLILLVLLLIRFVGPYLPIWFSGGVIPDGYANWYLGIVYILTVVVVSLNRHRLAALHIDRPFVIALMLSGLHDVFFLSTGIAIFVALATGLAYWAYQNHHFILRNTSHYPSGMLFLICMTVALAALPIGIFGLKLKSFPDMELILSTLFLRPWGTIVFEEVLFRGILWAYLQERGWKQYTIFLVQAFLFWTAHSTYLYQENPFTFWIVVPLGSLLLGLLVWRSKSLTPSTIAHFLYNFTTVLMGRLF